MKKKSRERINRIFFFFIKKLIYLKHLVKTICICRFYLVSHKRVCYKKGKRKKKKTKISFAFYIKIKLTP